MFTKKLDYKKIHKELRTIVKRQEAIKAEFPYKWQGLCWTKFLTNRRLFERKMAEGRPWRLARAEYERLGNKMNILCCILAHSKGKLHCKSMADATAVMYKAKPISSVGNPVLTVTMKHQEAMIKDSWEEYLLKEDSTVV